MSKYDALRDDLRCRTGEVGYTLKEISDLVPGGLPSSAYRYEAWWANGDPSHQHSRSWGDAGFTAHPNHARGTVRFIPEQRASQ
ncbi:DUF7662 domain-containing protein [Micromonospora zamorensis]